MTDNEQTARERILLRVERAMDDVRRGVPVIVEDEGNSLVVFPAEYTGYDTPAYLKRFADNAPLLVMTAMRAKRLGLNTSTLGPVCITLDTNSEKEFLAQVEQAVTVFERHPRQLNATVIPATPVQQAALQLVKLTSLLPGALLAALSAKEAETARETLQTVSRSDIETYPHHQIPTLTLVSEANVPLKDAEQARVLTFQPRFGTIPHLAIIIGDPSKSKSPLVRLHSSCMTGDILGSLRCDCGDQLHLAMKKMAEEGAGILLYLNQEGRGIGIANKLRAYTLQDQGLDTVEANEEMGFNADEREFEVAAEMLRQLKMPSVRLMTNNNHKVEMLTHFGISVTERVPLVIPATPFNQAYLDTKAKKCGHVF